MYRKRTMDKESMAVEYLCPFSIVCCRFNDDFTVDVLFSNGKAKRYDIIPYAEVFPMARHLVGNLELFKNPEHITQNAIRWDDKADITAEIIYHHGIDIELS